MARPIWRKKLSIFTSATSPYGAAEERADLRHRHRDDDVEEERRAGCTSVRAAGRRASAAARSERPNSDCPVCHSHSEIVPTGQIQLQNALRKRNEIARNAISMNMPAACISGTLRVRTNAFRFISDGDRQPRLDAVRPLDPHVVPPLSK